MSRGLLAEFFKIAKKQCANYGAVGPYGKPDYCYPGPHSCVLKEGKFCPYFDRAVIGYGPLKRAGWQQKWQDYWRQQKTAEMDREAGLVVKLGISGLVCGCGKTFAPKGRRQYQCPECRSEMKKEQTRLAVRRLRQRKRSGARF